MNYRFSLSPSLKIIAVAVTGLASVTCQVAQADITLTDDTNIKLSTQRVEAGDDQSETLEITSGLGGTPVPFTDDRPTHYNCCGPNYGASKLNDNAIGKRKTSDGFYAIANAGPEAVVLDFSGNQPLAGLAIYNGYGNRDDGTYTLKDMNGTVLGSWTISNTKGGTHAGVDSFWLTFRTPVTTSKLVIDTVSSEDNHTNSFREIQVFSADLPEIKLAVIGDSYTAGYGDNCDPYTCSKEPPLGWTTSYAAAPVMPFCGNKYGWAPKLAWFILDRGRKVTIVGQCTARNATSMDMYGAKCGPTVAANNPTHTIIFAGINDPKNDPGFTWYWVKEIAKPSQGGGQPIGGKLIHVQGNGEINPPNWQQNISNAAFFSGVPPQPCDLHPNGYNYWLMARNLLNNIQW